ncbi:LytTR family DNA-binding domain-containing protein [Phenylobacterium sp.]|jgi:hypothetical protein|uniref:LytTR family DNA-binding domain-containing protein n=1 Tax=Phenylobacterium sp. TaxID=1871053 RepID=UPI002F41D35F
MRRAASEGLWGGWAQDAVLVTVLGVFLAAIGPYGSYLNGPFWQRLVFQLPCCWLGWGVIGTGVRLAIARFRPGPVLWAATFATAAVAMAPVALLNIVMARWLWPFLGRYMTPLAWYSEGLILAAPISFAFVWLGLRRVGRARLRLEAAADPPAPAAGLLRARPREVLCLQMEDHYVRVRTPTGSHLVLATFQQALAALQGASGLRVHRSWWVADGAVARAELDGRNLRLILTDGLAVPVARSSVAEVRSRGWLSENPA